MPDSNPSLTPEEVQDLDNVLTRIQGAGAVLFLGAGASMASDAPNADELAKEMCREFAPDLTPMASFLDTMDRLQAKRGIDRIELDNWIVTRLSRLQPSDHHNTITKFSWPAIFTTNYDRLIEKAYDAEGSPAQILHPIRCADEEYEVLGPSMVTLHKLCGCVSKLQDKNCPIVQSRRDLRATAQSRRKMLKRLADYQRAHTWVFVGYSFRDGIITDLLSDLEESIGRDYVRWSYAIMRTVSDYDRDLLAQYKVKAISCSVQYFFEELAHRSSHFSVPDTEYLAHDHLSKLVDRPQLAELDNHFEWVQDCDRSDANSSSFYRGNQASWADLAANLDFTRDQTDALENMAQALLKDRNILESPTRSIVVTGTAGTGKSTLVRRVAWNLRESMQLPVFVAREGVFWEPRPLIDVARKIKVPFIVLIDAGDIDFLRVKGLLRALASSDVQALVLITARTGPWLAAQRHWGAIAVDHTAEIRENLSLSEVNALIDKLAAHEFIRITAVTDRNYWIGRAEHARRIALVVLLELVEQGRFDEIILSEYQDLTNDLASKAYRFVSAVHEFGIPIRRELLRRVLNCDWNEFITFVVNGAAINVVIEDFETVSERAYYRTKHPVIASIVREHTVGSPMTILENTFAQIDDADRTDATLARSILKNEQFEKVFPNHEDRRRLFEAAVAVLPKDVVVRHQMGINEMEHGYFEEARRVFETCLSLNPKNTAVTHSFGLLELEIAKQKSPGPLKELIYAKALGHFEQVIRLDKHSEYGYHSAAALFLNRAKYDELDIDKKTEFVARAFELVDQGMSEIDNREAGRLKSLKGQILEFVDQTEEARAEYQQSIEDGSATKDTFYLLARLELESGNDEIAERLIDRGLEEFEGDRRLLLLRAEMALANESLGRSQLLKLLGPAVRENPKRLNVVFAFAYVLYETGEAEESQRYFKRTANLSQGIFGRSRPRRFFNGKSGAPIRFQGTIERNNRRGGRLMIRREDKNDYVYFSVDRAIGTGVSTNGPVEFSIGFSYLGPIAWDLTKSHK